jgi:hypothetical protein
MSNRYEREAEDLYEAQNDASPVPGNVYDSSYVSLLRLLPETDQTKRRVSYHTLPID